MDRRHPTRIMLAIALTSLLAPSAQALARSRVSLAGIHLGMSHHQVRHVLGRPLRVSGSARPATSEDQWHYRQKLTVSFEAYPGHSPFRAVASVTTRSPVDKLPGGAHVGSPWRSVRSFKPKFCYRGTFAGPYNYFCQWYPTLKSIRQKPSQTNPTLCKPMIVFAQSEDLQRIAQLTLAYQAADGGCGGIVRS